MKRHRLSVLAAGVVLAALYTATLVVTMRASGRRVLPLYDGAVPAPRYQWVNPPKSFAAGNRVPRPSHTAVDLGAAGSPLQGFVSDDSQLVLNLPAGAIPPGPGAKAAVTITPVDPASLGPLPEGAAPDGNAYRVDIGYQPDNRPLGTLALPGSALLTVPASPEKVFTSVDGHTWAALDTVAVDATRVSFRFAAPGYVLASAAAVVVVPAVPSTADTARTLAVVGATLTLAAGLFFAPRVLRRIRGGGRTA